jgi:hypothetical protein
MLITTLDKPQMASNSKSQLRGRRFSNTAGNKLPGELTLKHFFYNHTKPKTGLDGAPRS